MERAGTYDIELRRWPRESDAALCSDVPPFKGAVGTLAAGKALPIGGAHVSVGNQEFDSAAAKDAKAVSFPVTLKAGKTTLHGWFSDDQNNPVCGAYFAYVTRRA